MQSGDQKTLTERLKEKTEKERQQVEKVFKDNLQSLSKQLQESSTKELATIETAIRTKAEKATSNLNRHYKILSIAHGKEWLRSTLITLSMMLGVLIASWAAFQGLAYWVKIEMNNLDEVQTKILEQRQTLNYLEEGTFGVYLMKEKRGRFIVLPEGYTVETRWTNGERQSLRLVTD